MMITIKKIFTFFFCITFITHTIAQTNDSIKLKLNDSIVLKEVTVHAYFNEQPHFRIPASIGIIDKNKIEQLTGTSMLPAMNTVPGVRMEERSPGSYRLSIRGSLLRSPFGIRNVKIYMDEFPLTDAGGNSYLNLLDVNAINRIEIIKGPDGSIFGANSGGVVRISPVDLRADSLQITGGVQVGSYQTFQQHVNVHVPIAKNIISFSEGLHSSDGFRDHSALTRKYLQLADQWNYSSRGQLRLFMFYANLKYQTPGGLTLQQWEKDPRSARPATQHLPGAAEQNAGVTNKTFYGGACNDWKISQYLRHVIAVFGSQTDFENPFITNYETRKENSHGIRTWFSASNHKEGFINLTFDAGVEAQQTKSRISNFRNRFGTKDTLQIADELIAQQYFIFGRAAAYFYNRLNVEISTSINYNQYEYTGVFPVPILSTINKFKPQQMPRVALSYLVSDLFALRASVSKGYSPPTLAEIRSSNNTINKDLQPETGWNYETGIRWRDKGGRFRWDASVFYYQLQQAIVRRVNDSGEEYFINSGGTKQLGLESQLTISFVPKQINRFIRRLECSSSASFNAGEFRNYKIATNDYSGNEITGVPTAVFLTTFLIELASGISVSSQLTGTSRLPLNDANTVYADAYNVIQFKLGWTHEFKNYNLQLFAGIDNIENINYSLGNDLNAVGNRYYNPASKRNYFIGMSFKR